MLSRQRRKHRFGAKLNLLEIYQANHQLHEIYINIIASMKSPIAEQQRAWIKRSPTTGNWGRVK
jgi:hypothetical protein